MAREKIGFIGTGVMGSSMARNLMKAGYPVSVYTRTKEKAEKLIEEGAAWAASPKELAKEADIVISIVGYPKDVEEIYLGAEGVLAAKEGGIVIDDVESCARQEDFRCGEGKGRRSARCARLGRRHRREGCDARHHGRR